MKKFTLYLIICVSILCSCDDKENKTNLVLIDQDKRNRYFSIKNLETKKFKGRFSGNKGELIERDVKVYANLIVKSNFGSVYKLEIEPTKNVSGERLILGNFYILKDKIYKIEPSENNLNKIKNNEFFSEGIIVCQEEEIPDYLGGNTKGEHRYLTVKGNKREFHMYNDRVNTGYFETYVWEKNIGLKYYKSGYGAEKDLIEIKLIEGVNG